MHIKNTNPSNHSRSIFPVFLFFLVFLNIQSAFAVSYEKKGDEETIQEFLQDTFQDFLYHGAYMDEENHYLVISLKIHPGRLSKIMQQDPHSIDEILADQMIRSLYSRRFSFYLLGASKIQGVSVILTWEGCQRTAGHAEPEKILLKDGTFEFDRFDVSRNLYFNKLGMVQSASDIFSAGKLFDQIAFTHLTGDRYEGIPFHRTSDSP
ncbi:MAG: hypothetical protein CO150_07985 [Nitrospirae bacterium CG_4_9_14_3_um_filter_53_35]|nr:MAG: hypothetical protein AUK29_02500 [Nitrospirae bacterium CG2_30_53_67]PIS37680.1 MAG: hypothetical protein COT35_04720 [Nitrospirae bacterium CG08_land_8_20_14_0_20_52_24]PIV85227.1 MAG: hypothetical protein COW52_03435 [Nitrospirae bacterium CG17_big_fil_post_rev_8_21_14_2_50_50_9]PIW86166.1 MAG: hypothetical protein COZ95_00750 [Nitrospirae bacterium CG_4_8_14_3_um_filter_50_41]PIX85452.1 MAG: hypothetical protein COZ32_08365 [Nitrospirae bacterium CG_4_10_14_3_um_filter_53_41]PJA7345